MPSHSQYYRRASAQVDSAVSFQTNTEPVSNAFRFKVLVVDDSPIYRKLIEQSLPSENYHILFAKNGREALDVFGEQRPAVVITDWSMPDISGLELCQHIRKDFPQHYTYLILITSNSNKEQVVEGLAAGADDYLTKPFHSGELAARVAVGRRIIELHGQIETKNKQLEELALRDPLTGLPNRRGIDLWVDSHFSAAARYGFQIWVVIADLDHFKMVNDTYGHEAGDTVLKKFSQLLKSNTRRSNLCGRLGGEEFLLILTHVDPERALVAIDRIRKHLELQEFRFGNARATVTASFGVKGFSGSQSPEFNVLLARADAALYVAKSKGRNRVEFDPDAISANSIVI
jgi:two-component system cell cycle response regulator